MRRAPSSDRTQISHVNTLMEMFVDIHTNTTDLPSSQLSEVVVRSVNPGLALMFDPEE